GMFTARCHNWFMQNFGMRQPLLTTSCTDALELAALLLNIGRGDEVILPAYTFVSTANAFILRGAVPVFADSSAGHPNIDAAKIEALITPRTRAIVVVHYAGMSCDMDTVMQLSANYNIPVIEDAAQAIGAMYRGKQRLGTIGALGAFSFHETKNIIAGEGGMLSVNDAALAERAEIIREKGTNRSAFFRGEAAKYEWLEPGSSFLPSDIIAAFLYAQLEQFDVIQQNRISRWNRYNTLLSALSDKLVLPQVPDYADVNGNIYYICCNSQTERNALIEYLRDKGIYAAFHYLCLHRSPYFADKYSGVPLHNAERFEQTLVRLPIYFGMNDDEQDFVAECIHAFYQKQS
ncbi:MAG: dTDP-4-amino-4,6-dideoxygalactose transaminase, partial [Bacteroidia bacterium]